MTTTKNRLLRAAADHVLAAGLREASLRPLAAAAGTSDRMLIYHFDSKDQLMAEIMSLLADDMTYGVEALLGDSDVPIQNFKTVAEAASTLEALLSTEAFEPYIQVWLEIVAVAARNGEPHKAIAAAIMDRYASWILDRLSPSLGASKETARDIISRIAGNLLMKAIGRPKPPV